MAPRRKYGQGVTRLKDSIATDGATGLRTVTEHYVGPYEQLLALMNAQGPGNTCNLEHEGADSGRLRVARTPTRISGSFGGGAEDQGVLEVLWVELRKKIEEHPRYEHITPAQWAEVEKALDENETAPDFPDGVQDEAWQKKRKGITEWSVGVPVVRRTTVLAASASIADGNAWFRDNPPVAIGGYEFLKTLDDRRRQGGNQTRVEEWTGAETWDAELYP